VTREQEIIEAYEAHEGTVDALVDQLGISKQRLYQVLAKHGIAPRTRRPDINGRLPGNMDDALGKMMADNALAFLVNQLTEARMELAEYREKYGPL